MDNLININSELIPKPELRDRSFTIDDIIYTYKSYVLF